ncbi:uncharacterized protein RSE6_07874 [Rhynchosporium secalis]|uniref:BTB domain-containing protein n=1 Tax=Rhynchosporium secalis TaxID=38038 RepID=A0A1E1MDZ6_RHYSE|nr:uncharacterized protein RSE6_07874 [Rhynchosporium secalis]
MSSYGEDFADEEINNIEHRGASQGESDSETSFPGDGERLEDIPGYVALGGRGADGNDGFGKTSVIGSATTVDTKVVSGSPNPNGAEVGGAQGSNPKANGVGLEASVDPSGTLNEGREASQRLKLLRSPDVTVSVGHEEQCFTVPKDLLFLNSKFFDRALNGKFKEGAEQVISLPEDTVMAFQMMLQWIYGSVTLHTYSPDFDRSDVTGFYLDFFKLADKIDFLGYLHSFFKDFRAHLARWTELRFTNELETVNGFCKTLLKEIARLVVKDDKMIDPLSSTAVVQWPHGFPAPQGNDGWSTSKGNLGFISAQLRKEFLRA